MINPFVGRTPTNYRRCAAHRTPKVRTVFGNRAWATRGLSGRTLGAELQRRVFRQAPVNAKLM